MSGGIGEFLDRHRPKVWPVGVRQTKLGYEIADLLLGERSSLPVDVRADPILESEDVREPAKRLSNAVASEQSLGRNPDDALVAGAEMILHGLSYDRVFGPEEPARESIPLVDVRDVSNAIRRSKAHPEGFAGVAQNIIVKGTRLART